MIANEPSATVADAIARRRVIPDRIMRPPIFAPAYPPRKRGRDKKRPALLPVAVDLVPVLDPFVAQLDVLFEVRRPRFDDFRIVARWIERRVLQRGQIAEFLDLERLPLLGHAPVQK